MDTADLTSSQAENPEQGALETFKAPPGAGTLGTWLFTAGLTVAFAWLLFGYTVTRMKSDVPSPPMPVWFWFSTFFILVSSVTLHWSYLSARMGRVTVAKQALRLATVLGIIFLLLQVPGLVKLVQGHRGLEGVQATPYVLVLALVSLHGLHVLVGIGRLLVLNKKKYTQIADEHGGARLKQMCLFWHFLAVVWVAMFGVILWA